MFRYSNRWFSLRMDLLGTLTIVTVSAVTVASRGGVSAAAAGLALANVFQVCQLKFKCSLTSLNMEVLGSKPANLGCNYM